MWWRVLPRRRARLAEAERISAVAVVAYLPRAAGLAASTTASALMTGAAPEEGPLATPRSESANQMPVSRFPPPIASLVKKCLRPPPAVSPRVPILPRTQLPPKRLFQARRLPEAWSTILAPPLPRLHHKFLLSLARLPSLRNLSQATQLLQSKKFNAISRDFSSQNYCFYFNIFISVSVSAAQKKAPVRPLCWLTAMSKSQVVAAVAVGATRPWSASPIRLLQTHKHRPISHPVANKSVW